MNGVAKTARSYLPVRSRSLAARLWWMLLPYAGYFSHREPGDPRPPLHAYPLAWAWKLVGRLDSSAPFEPMEPVHCDCDYCRGVPGARFEA